MLLDFPGDRAAIAVLTLPLAAFGTQYSAREEIESDRDVGKVMQKRNPWFVWLLLSSMACGGRTALDGFDLSSGVGGVSSSGGTTPIGGSPATGGSNSTGATVATGGSAPTSVTQLALGLDHSCARLTEGTVKCWGNSDYGQLGDGTATRRLVPVVVQGLSSAADIGAGSNHSCARLADGTVQCWGWNDNGQLGGTSSHSFADGTSGSLTPIPVLGLSSATNVVAGSYHSCARLADRTVECWGSNYFAQLGDGTTTNSSRPVLVQELP